MNNKEYNKAVGNRIKHIRALLGMTLEDVASKLNITRQTLRNYECGKTPLKIGVVYQLCKIYNISPSLIIGFTDTFTIPDENIRICFPPIKDYDER